MKMIKIFTGFGYDFYKSLEAKKGKSIYNVVKKNSPVPSGGYYDSDYICNIKGVPNPFKNSKLSIS